MAKKITVELEVKADEAVDQIQEVNKQVQKLQKTTQDSVEGINAMTKSVGRLSKGFRALGLTLKAMGIGFLLEAFSAIKEAAKGTQEISDFFTTTQNFMTFFVQEVGHLIREGASLLEIMGSLDEISARAFERAKEQTKLDNEALLLAAQQNLKRMQGLKLQEKLRQLRDDETQSVKERIIANELLNEELEKALDIRRKDLDRQLAAVRNRMIEGEGNIALEVQEFELLAEIADLEEEIVGFQSEQKINQMALNRELAEANRLRKEGHEILSKDDLDPLFIHEIDQIQNTMDKLEEADRLAAKSYERRRENLLDIIKNEDEYYLDRLRASKELEELELEESIRQRDLAIQKRDVQIEMANQVFNAIQGLAVEGSQFAKGIAVAQAIMNTWQGVTKAWGQGGIYGFIGAAVVLANGLAAVRKILATDPRGETTDGGGASAAPISNPQLAIDATANPTNQVSVTIDEPVRSYVVAQDVTTQQALDRRIAGNSVFGG